MSFKSEDKLQKTEICCRLHPNWTIQEAVSHFHFVAGWNQSQTLPRCHSPVLSWSVWTSLNKTSSDSAALFTNSVRRQKAKSNSPQRSCSRFPPFFIHYLRHNRNKIYRESQTEQNSSQHIPGCAFWIIHPEPSLWSSLAVYCTSLSMTVVKQYSCFAFHSSSLTLGCFAL